MKASLSLAAGLMLAMSAAAQQAAKIHYPTPVTKATPLGFSLTIQYQNGAAVAQSVYAPAVVIVGSQGGNSTRGAYYQRPVVRSSPGWSANPRTTYHSHHHGYRHSHGGYQRVVVRGGSVTVGTVYGRVPGGRTARLPVCAY